MPSCKTSILELTRDISALGPRLPGSKEERECLRVLSNHLSQVGVATRVDEFKFISWSPKSQSIIDPEGRTLHCSQLGYSPSGSFSGELAYCGYGDRQDFSEARCKVALVESGWNAAQRFLHRIQKYSNAVKAGAGAFVLLGQPGRSPPRGIIRKRTLGQIPAVSVSYPMGRTMLKSSAKGEFTVTTESLTAESTSANLVAELPGKEPGILLCAHTDSWTNGAWDNASGTAVLVSLCQLLASKPPKHRISALFCGAEELGLFGSMKFAAEHADEFAFAINIDGVGLRGARLQVRCSNRPLSRIPPLRGIYSDLPLTPWGDHWSFRRAGIQTMFVTTNGANLVQHTEEDGPDCLDEKELQSALHLIFKIVSYLDSFG